MPCAKLGQTPFKLFLVSQSCCSLGFPVVSCLNNQQTGSVGIPQETNSPLTFLPAQVRGKGQRPSPSNNPNTNFPTVGPECKLSRLRSPLEKLRPGDVAYTRHTYMLRLFKQPARNKGDDESVGKPRRLEDCLHAATPSNRCVFPQTGKSVCLDFPLEKWKAEPINVQNSQARVSCCSLECVSNCVE